MKRNLLFAILSVFFYFSLQAQSLFGPPQLIPQETETLNAVHTAKLDGDKYVDVLSFSYIDKQIVWYRNEGGNGFGEAQVIGTAEVVLGLKAADLDGDGDNDIFAVSESRNEVFWYQNEGNGQFGEIRVISGELLSPRDVYAEDVDGDGDMDVLSASHGDGKIAWYENDGQGNFGVQQVIHTDELSSSAVSVADIDGDGDMDVLSTSYNSHLLNWHENLGGAGSWQTHLISGAFNGFNSVSAADLDGDGDKDVLATAFQGRVAVWYENDGNGGFDNFSVLVDEDKLVTNAHAADLDKDGDLDVLVAVYGGHKTVWLENDGQGNFGTQKIINENAEYTRDVITADIDRDGDLDVLSTVPTYGQVFWFENLLKPNQIVTLLFHDRNENGLYDNTEEQPLFDFKMLLNPTESETFTNLEGFNYLFADYGDYDLTFEPNPLWELTTSPISYPIEYEEDVILPVYQFGFRPTQLVSEAIPYLSSTPTRCNRVSTYWLNYSNTGTVTANGQITLEVHEGMEFVSAIPPPSLIEEDRLTWNITDLHPTYENKIRVRFLMPDFNSIGVILESQAALQLFDENQNVIYSRSTDYSSELLCAYDPNDKLARSNILGQSEFAYIEDTILYTVRFQNTGNDVAFNIRVEDILDKKLDLTTFHPITASHDYRTELNRETGLATFYFDDIMLPDSTANEEESHGFVTFGIASLANVGDKTEVENTAGIFFDFNPAIVTNTAVLTLIKQVETGIEGEILKHGYSIAVYPNPFSDLTTIEVKDLPEGNYQLEVMDILGRKVLKEKYLSRNLGMENGKLILKRGELESGVYVFRILKNNKQLIGSDKLWIK